MNRILAAVAKMEKQIAERIANGITTAAKVKKTHKNLDMELGEYCRF